jgi:hypothetical protein
VLVLTGSASLQGERAGGAEHGCEEGQEDVHGAGLSGGVRGEPTKIACAADVNAEG